jgi:hypothetical protein
MQGKRILDDGTESTHVVCGDPLKRDDDTLWVNPDALLEDCVHYDENGEVERIDGDWSCSLEYGHEGRHEAWEVHTYAGPDSVSFTWGEPRPVVILEVV